MKDVDLRNYFAAKAMQALITNAKDGNIHNLPEGVELAYKWADEMIKQGNAKNND